jgi:hypothetical protein
MPAMDLTSELDRRLAYRSAGSITAALLLGIPITGASIEGPQPTVDWHVFASSSCEDLAAATLAADVAARLAGFTVTAADREAGRDQAKLSCGFYAGASLDDWFAEQEHRAKSLLLSHWRLVRAIAEALAQSRSLEFADIMRTCSRTSKTSFRAIQGALRERQTRRLRQALPHPGHPTMLPIKKILPGIGR